MRAIRRGLQGAPQPGEDVLARVPDEVLSLDGELDGPGEGVRGAAERAHDEPPELAAPGRAQADAPEGAQEHAEAPGPPVQPRLRATDRVDEELAALVERVGPVELAEQLGVPCEKRALVHGGLEIRAVELVASRHDAEPPLLLQATRELRPRKGGEHPDHRHRNRDRGDEVALQVEDLRAVVVESDDEPGEDLEARAGDAAHRLGWVEPQVLELVRLLERLG